MKRKIVIFGAGGHGRGTLEILRARRAAGFETPEPIGFVDDACQEAHRGPLPVLGTSTWIEEHAGEGFALILAIADPKTKKALDERFNPLGIAWASAVHPSAILGGGCQLEEGTIIGAGVVVNYDTVIGRHTTINLNATVGHDCVIGDYVTVAPGVNITGGVHLGEGALVQTNATVLPGIELGAFSHVGPGSVVLRSVGEGEFHFGNPARRMPKAGV